MKTKNTLRLSKAAAALLAAALKVSHTDFGEDEKYPAALRSPAFAQMLVELCHLADEPAPDQHPERGPWRD